MSGTPMKPGARGGRSVQWHAMRIALLLALGAAVGSCQDGKRGTAARVVATRTDLIGGPSALGELGDFLLENDKVRIIIQDKGFSRGFGVYGGSLIDADLRRPIGSGTPAGGRGRDQFGEMFPVFLVEALEPDSVVIESAGGDDEPARVRVSGTGNDFLSLTKALNRAFVNSHELPDSPLGLLDPTKLNGEPQLTFSITYELAPDSRAVRMDTSLTNITDDPLAIPSPTADLLLRMLTGGADDVDVPLGYVTLFGAGNHVFAPGFGYDIRFSLEEAFEATLPFPAFPGLVVPGMVSTSTNGISYGLFAAPNEGVENFLQNRVDEEGRNRYAEAYGTEPERDSMLIPFVASAFTGVFYAQAPRNLDAGETFTYSAWFIIGDGDVGSVMDEVYRLRNIDTGKIRGRVLHGWTNEPVADASVVVYDADDKPVSQFYTDAAGHIVGQLPPGRYSARVEQDPVLGDPVPFEIRSQASTFVDLSRPAGGYVSVEVRDVAGRKLPAKVTAVGRIDSGDAGKVYPRFLFDLAAGQRWRTSDYIPDDPDDPDTLRYIENICFTEEGRCHLELPVGPTFEIYVSRGIEYTLHHEPVTPKAGQTVSIAARLDRVVDTTGYISADFHVHAAPSLDSDVSLHDRMLSAAGEGVEFVVASDHNFVTDYQPYIERAGLTDWLSSMVSIELTTLESGHFNAFPLKREVGAITKGSFEWSLRPPAEIFEALRDMASDESRADPDAAVVVQVNHPRDSIMGYFQQYGMDPLTGDVPEERTGSGVSGVIDPSGPAFYDDDGKLAFSYDFDAIEVLNGGLPVQIFHTRMPESIDGLEIPEEILPDLPEPGTILCDDDKVAFPGVVDDWFNLLNKGHRHTGLANTDSHHDDDIGFPRTYMGVGVDDPAFVRPTTITAAVRDHRALMTNGPFLELFVNDEPVGAKLSDTDGTIDVRIRIRAAPWIDCDQATLIANGEVLETFDVKLEEGAFEISRTYTLSRDTWILAHAQGDQPLFPIRPSIDLPPILLNDALTAFAEPLGFGASVLGALEPQRAAAITPLAMTNPIWIDVDGDPFEAPGIRNRTCKGYGVADVVEQEEKRDPAAAAASPSPQPGSRNPSPGEGAFDVRRLFGQFCGHGH